MSNEPTEPPSRERVDPEFRALPLTAVADAALSNARAGGAEHADVRVERIVSQSLSLRDGVVVHVADSPAGLAGHRALRSRAADHRRTASSRPATTS